MSKLLPLPQAHLSLSRPIRLFITMGPSPCTTSFPLCFVSLLTKNSYLAKAPSTAAAYDGSGAAWFKIWQQGPTFGNPVTWPLARKFQVPDAFSLTFTDITLQRPTPQHYLLRSHPASICYVSSRSASTTHTQLDFPNSTSPAPRSPSQVVDQASQAHSFPYQATFPEPSQDTLSTFTTTSTTTLS